MGIKITYHPLVTSYDIPRLPAPIKSRVKISLVNKLSTNPTLYGFPLHGILKKYWKLRVGDYRIVYGIERDEVKVHVIAHRKEVYRIAANRL